MALGQPADCAIHHLGVDDPRGAAARSVGLRPVRDEPGGGHRTELPQRVELCQLADPVGRGKRTRHRAGFRPAAGHQWRAGRDPAAARPVRGAILRPARSRPAAAGPGAYLPRHPLHRPAHCAAGTAARVPQPGDRQSRFGDRRSAYRTGARVVRLRRLGAHLCADRGLCGARSHNERGREAVGAPGVRSQGGAADDHLRRRADAVPIVLDRPEPERHLHRRPGVLGLRSGPLFGGAVPDVDCNRTLHSAAQRGRLPPPMPNCTRRAAVSAPISNAPCKACCWWSARSTSAFR